MMRQQLTLFGETESLPAAAPKPKQRVKTDVLDELCDQVLQRCAAEGINPKTVLMMMQVQHLRDDYLCRLSRPERWEFIARIINVVVELDGERLS